MRVASDFDHFRLFNFLLDHFLELGLRHVERRIRSRVGVDVVQNPVRVHDFHGAAGREREHVRHVVASLLIEGHVTGLHVALGALDDDDCVGDSAAAVNDQVFLEVLMEPANFFVLGHFDRLGRRRGAVILHLSANRAAGSAREAGADAHAERDSGARRQYNSKLLHYHFPPEQFLDISNRLNKHSP